MTKLLFLPGSLRAASSSRALTRKLVDLVGDRASCETADIGALPHYNADVTDDATVDAFIASVGAADGVVFVTPEYNYSVPGVLKNAIDWASRPAFESVFKGKPCFIVTVSGGATGGIRAQGHLKYILNGMLAVPHADREIVVPFANKKVTDGVFEDADVLAFAGAQLDDFLAGLG
ncbi:NADPH-dependent FMN reductase [Mesobacterium pallidum]|uniref:NADPH-dependent FMN reductase n=1 Tax=Mesobacterium pallidum TaxID=2872037 RepID=UPI001EE29090|nr:NAD(P)H-dependent oxidoreductase [Mesobacterium pallidum]